MTYDDTKFKQHSGTYLAYSVTYTNIDLIMYNIIISFINTSFTGINILTWEDQKKLTINNKTMASHLKKQIMMIFS